MQGTPGPSTANDPSVSPSEPENNRYICPAGQFLNYGGRVYRNRAFQLHRDTKEVWPVLAPPAMHQCCLPGSYHPPERTSPTTRTGVGQHAGVRSCPAAKKESGSLVRGTEESDWTAPPTLAAIEVCSRAVLPGSGGPKHQATRAVPQPTDSAGSARHPLARSEEQLGPATLAAEQTLR